MHPKFGSIRVRTHDLQIVTVHSMSLNTSALTTLPSVTLESIVDNHNGINEICLLMLEPKQMKPHKFVLLAAQSDWVLML